MTSSHSESTPAESTPPATHRFRFELVVASILLAFGLFVLPGLVFWVGKTLLGAYGKDAGIGAFYGDFYGDLASGVVRTWMLALGPVVVVSVIRLLFLKRSDPSETPAAAPQPRQQQSTHSRRVEPRVNLE